ncbi:unnamed protein product [Pleuronectes platessa]|uniref:Uncharacterized protein n=1 Tax=Pleuronectes platessa TaxID=8262 RepID=A0A9N7VTY1_PLEPL|nr:unnamed protein product [Pleuronectes platessa]
MSGCWTHVCGSLLLDLSLFVYAVLHVADHPGSSGDLAGKQSLQSGNQCPACRPASSAAAAGCSVTGWSPAPHCEADDATADFTHLRAGHVSPAQGSPRLQAQHLAQDHFGMQMGKTGIDLLTFCDGATYWHILPQSSKRSCNGGDACRNRRSMMSQVGHASRSHRPPNRLNVSVLGPQVLHEPS